MALFLVFPLANAFALVSIELNSGVEKQISLNLTSTSLSADLVKKTNYLEKFIKSDLSLTKNFSLISTKQPDYSANITVEQPLSIKNGLKIRLQIHQGFSTLANNDKEVTTIGDRNFLFSGQDIRPLGHRLADFLYTTILGRKSFFTTKIAFIRADYQKIKLIRDKNLYFNRLYTLEISDADGQNIRKILQSYSPILTPRFSPDGKKIAYVSLGNHQASIHLLDLRTAKDRLLTDYPGINGAPSWNPDGKRLAIVLSMNGVAKIYEINLQDPSIHPQKITPFGNYSVETEPVYSLNGKYLYYTSNASGTPQIYQYDLKEKSSKRITFCGRYNTTAVPSRDPNLIIFLHHSKNGFNIYWQDLRSQACHPLIEERNCQSPGLSPDESMIIFAINYGSKGHLEIRSLDNRIKRPFPVTEPINGEFSDPDWSKFLT